MKLVNRYILQELVKLFLAVLLVISVGFVIQRLIFLTEWSMHRGVGIAGVLKLLVCLFPSLFLTAIPLVSLFVIIIALSRLSEDNELVVMMSSGRDLLSLAKPILFFSLFCAVFTGYLAFFLAPWSIRRFETIRWDLVETKSEQALPTQTFVDFSGDSQIYIQDKTEQGLEKLIIIQTGESDWPFSGSADSRNIIFANRARIENHPEKLESRLLLENGAFISHQDQPELDQFVQFEKAAARIDIGGAERLKDRLAHQVRSSSTGRLLTITKDHELTRQDKWGNKTRVTLVEDARIELNQRISQVLSCLLLGLWGLGLGIKPPRTSRTVSYILGASAGFGFYYLNVLFTALAFKKMLPIEMALFSPSILILLSGAWLLRERLQGREPLNFLYQLDQYVRQRRTEKKTG